MSNAYNESTVQRHGRELLMEGSLLSASENEERKKKRHSEHMRGICGKVGLVGISSGFVLALGSYEEQ